jgi:hypothetical protein
MHLLAALVDLPGPVWPAFMGTAVAFLAWFEIRR